MILTSKEEDLIRKIRKQQIRLMTDKLTAEQLVMLNRVAPDIAALEDDETRSLIRLLERTTCPTK